MTAGAAKFHVPALFRSCEEVCVYVANDFIHVVPLL